MLVLLDTDFLYNFFFASQSNHQQSKKILVDNSESDFVISRPVKYEFLTVISNKEDHQRAKQVLLKLEELDVGFLEINQEVEDLAIDMFLNSSKNRTSVVDCLNLALAQKYNCKIASFDKFYPKEMLLG